MNDFETRQVPEHPSRRLWRLYEPIHASIYFAHASARRYRELGLKGGWMSYFASRSAALGTPSAEVVYATFYHFSPALVERAIPDAWNYASSREILEARQEIGEEIIRDRLSGLDPANISNAASVLYEVATSLKSEGRPLFAAHKDMDWGRNPDLMLFGAATLLREHRGDTHNAALTAHGIDGVEAQLLQVAASVTSFEALMQNRGWSESQWQAGYQRLVKRQIFADTGLPGLPQFTTEGRSIKVTIEAQTDSHCDFEQALGSSELEALMLQLEMIAKHFRGERGVPKTNPIGV